MCAFRKNDKCPPWEIRSGVMTHDKIKKTIYYDDTVVKIFDIPVFFFQSLLTRILQLKGVIWFSPSNIS